MTALRLAGGCAVLLVAACFDPKFNPQTLCGPDGACPSGTACRADHCVPIDADSPGSPDGAGSAADPNCLGNFIRVCIDASSQPITVPGAIDTSAGTSSPCLATASTTPVVDVCVILVAERAIPDVTVTGDRPLILASRGSLTVSGTLDAGSYRDRTATGPGADAAACSSDGKPPTGSLAGGGGWGGSFGAAGGAGGGGPAGTGGQAPSAVSVDRMLRGGCSGGSGSGDPAMAPPGEPGHGGGAVLLVARGVLTIDGTVNASGGGGGNGKEFGGAGGGGGAGGMIVLDASAVTVNGQCFANGGGGGGSASNRGTGTPGRESIAAGTPGAGGRGADLGGGGGTGGFGTAPGGAQGSAGGSQPGTASGGGGGGGSVGVIKVVSPQVSLSTQVSPAPS